MKKLYTIVIAASLIALILPSCKKVLQKVPETTLTPTEVFSDSLVTVFYLNTIYTNNLPSWGGNTGGAIGSVGPGSLTEENTGGSPYTAGSVTMETVGDIGTANSNSNTYAKIRNINDFITGMQTSPIAPDIKKRFIAQAVFFRALRYFELVKIYGGVPLETGTLSVIGTAAKVAADLPRNTTTQTWTQIVADLDTAINGLPAKWPNSADYGRITKGAAQAYLGRVLLTWASPQFNSSNDVTRWQTALTACNAAITTLTAAGYGLYPKEDVTMWTTEGGSNGVPSNIEAVMVTEYNNLNSLSNPSTALNNGYTQAGIPKALFGNGGNNPTWTEVQAFPMADGCPINSTVATCPGKTLTYNQNLYFDNRDPRFNQTIAYNGCLWPLEGNNLNRIWTYYYYTKANSSTIATTEASGASSTGFYCRKAIDPSITASLLPYSGTDWIEIRYAEVILNRAEAAAQTGDLTTAYADLVSIRKRAGILAGSNNLYGLVPGMSQAQMVSAILLERQIEFAYEGKRYWDLRRYMLLESTLNGKFRQGLVTTLNVNASSYTDYLLATRDGLAATSLDNVYNTYFTSSTISGTVYPAIAPKNLDNTAINYQTADYFFGIPTASIQSDPNLLQNNTWGGPFNPLL